MRNKHTKTERQKLIKQLVNDLVITTQSEMREALKASGVEVDQATVSRDIKELGLVRVADASSYRYSFLEGAQPTKQVLRLATQLIRRIDWSGNLLVVHTESASAHPVAEAIDHLGIREILGTIAGENTVLAVVREGCSTEQVAERIMRMKETK